MIPSAPLRSMRYILIGLTWLVASALSLHGDKTPTQQTTSDKVLVETLPQLPAPLIDGYLGVDQDTTFVLAGTEADDPVLKLDTEANEWSVIGQLEASIPKKASTETIDGLLLAGGQENGSLSKQVWHIQYRDGAVIQTRLPDLPQALLNPALAKIRNKIYVAGGTDADGKPTQSFYSLDESLPEADWESVAAWPGAAISKAKLIASQSMMFLVGGVHQGGSISPTYRFHPDTGWVDLPALPDWPVGATVVPFGHSHAYLFGGKQADGSANGEIVLYHTITNTLAPTPAPQLDGDRLLAITRGKDFILTNGDQVVRIEPIPVKTGYIWLDHSVVALYMVGMVWMGFYFSKREKGAGDFFRGGNRVPWWVSGMSLFATGASAISLMSLPGKAYATSWEYFALSICTVMLLPISLFFLAPLIRRLNFATPYAYLEQRFGLSVRIFGSILFIFSQVCGRMASVMLLPAIALSAITGMSIVTCILIMGIITTVYTYFGGLEAVVWTDTIQGFIMIASISGCLLLALFALDMGPAEMFQTAQNMHKLEMFDFSLNITYPTTIIFFIAVFHLTLSNLGDQNFVQRVQCTPDMRQTKLAIATQMAVAIPINILLFGLGTALFLFYLKNPSDLDPTMKTDGIYPFFVADNLPAGVSGLVVASLFAATMSTISSSICSVADLCVADFYKRFNKTATDHSCLVIGRILTAVVGAAGTLAAIYLSKADITSIWDLAQMVVTLISCGVVGVFMLGLFTKRANEAGTFIGIILGLAVVVTLKYTSPVSLWLYGAIGSTVTFVTGYAFSFVLPSKVKPLDGLTVFSLPKGHADE